MFFIVSPHPIILSKYELKTLLLFSKLLLLLFFKELLNHNNKSCNKIPFDILLNISIIAFKPISLPIALKVLIFILRCSFLFDRFYLRQDIIDEHKLFISFSSSRFLLLFILIKNFALLID